MNRILHFAAFAAGLAVLAWTTFGYLGQQHALAVGMTMLVGAFYVAGAIELQHFGRATASLESALAGMPAAMPELGPWLSRLHPSLRNPVRLRVEGERAALPGPALAPYLAGLLVLLGMLGTFLGMVATLNGTGAALDSAIDVQAVRATLAAPVRGLGLAFGTSVAGVAASAMLGLMSSLRRRERVAAGQALDTAIATTALRGFTRAHQREEAMRLLQAQAGLMPALVDRLEQLMQRIEEQGDAAGARLADQQASFHTRADAAFTRLAESVGQSLRASLAESARLAGEAIGPAVEATMSRVAGETGKLQQALATHGGHALAAAAESFDRRAADLLERLALAQAEQRQLIAQQDEHRQAAWQRSLAQVAGTLQQEWRQSGTEGLARQREICHALEQTAQRLAADADARARDTLAEVARLMQAAAEAPRAAAQVVGEMRQRLSESLVRDTAALDERNRLLQTLDTLLQAVNRASHEQRGAIDALVESTGAVLDRVGAQFAEKAGTEAGKLGTVAAQVTSSAMEVASLGEAFGAAVSHFGETGERLMAQLARVEAALGQSLQRSDEQLGYYVAQARDLVELSVMSQKQIIDELQRLATRRPALAAEEA